MQADILYSENPAIVFEGKSFCLTGQFDGHGRPQLERLVEAAGGLFTPSAHEGTDYVVVGSKGIRCCSFACCTRVVEKALVLKTQGARLQFIREVDFLAVLPG